jgi:hypothetical protein
LFEQFEERVQRTQAHHQSLFYMLYNDTRLLTVDNSGDAYSNEKRGQAQAKKREKLEVEKDKTEVAVNEAGSLVCLQVYVKRVAVLRP